jgi:hypothetical protein
VANVTKYAYFLAAKKDPVGLRRRNAAKVRDLTDRGGRGAKGGTKGEAFVRLPGASISVSDVMKTSPTF